MALTHFCALLLVLSAVQLIRAEYDPEVCSLFKQSCGLIPPPLPRNFELKGDSVNYLAKEATYHEMHFDFSNSRAKYIKLLRGVEKHLLFDYDARQVVEWDILHPGLDERDDPLSWACTATDMDDSEYRDIFGFQDEYSNWPKMYDANQVLRFGGQYQYAFNGTERLDERGVLVDNFVGCVYDEALGSTMAMNYSFTNQWVYSSGGTAMQDVVSAGDGMLPVPAKVSSFGTVYDEVSKERNAFNKTESIFWFKGQPDFALETFRIPPYMYCEDFRGRKDMPQFPDAFSTRVQKTVVQRDTLGNLATSEVTSFEQIYYYKDKALARRDFTPDPDLDVDIINKFLSKDPIRSVYDFNTGVMYLTSIPTGRCYYRPIIPGDFFDASKQHMYIKMADPAEIFRMEHDKMEYKGNDFSRDIECDVFAGKYFDEHYNATFIKETYISTNGWHEEADELLEYGVPVKHTILTEELSWQLVDNVTTYHFLKFKAKAPVLRIFDVSNCIETINHKDYAIMLTVSTSERSTIFKYKTQFLESAQWYLAEITAVFTPLRIQRLQLRQVSLASSDTSTLLAFTLVDKPRLKTQTPVGQPGSTFQEALSRLQHFIDRNQFALKFTAPQEIEPITVKALKGSLYVHTADGDLQAPEPIETEETDPEDEVTPSLLQADEEAEGSGRPMMSNGSLALLAFAMLFIGIGIGIAIMYLYLRRVNENKLEDRITLTPQTSTTEPDPLPTV